MLHAGGGNFGVRTVHHNNRMCTCNCKKDEHIGASVLRVQLMRGTESWLLLRLPVEGFGITIIELYQL